MDNIDIEKLRKRLVTTEMIRGMIINTHAHAGNCINASEATPEQLIAIAKRKKINLDKYRLD